MSELSSFFPLHLGIFEHIEDGRVDDTMFLIYVAMLKQCDYETGVWIGSAGKLQALWVELPLRTIQDAMARLAQRGYIKKFNLGRGRRGNYDVLIDNYQPRFGVLRGKALKAAASTDSKNPVYVDVQSTCSEPSNGRAADVHVPEVPEEKREPANQLIESKTETPATRCSDCRHLLPGHNPGCVTGGVPLKQKGEISATPTRRDPVREWNESLCGYSAADIRKAVVFQLDIKRDPWFRPRINPAFLRNEKTLRKLMDDTPALVFETKTPKKPRLKYGGFARSIDEETNRRMKEHLCASCNNAGCSVCEEFRQKLWATVSEETV